MKNRCQERNRSSNVVHKVRRYESTAASGLVTDVLALLHKLPSLAAGSPKSLHGGSS